MIVVGKLKTNEIGILTRPQDIARGIVTTMISFSLTLKGPGGLVLWALHYARPHPFWYVRCYLRKTSVSTVDGSPHP